MLKGTFCLPIAMKADLFISARFWEVINWRTIRWNSYFRRLLRITFCDKWWLERAYLLALNSIHFSSISITFSRLRQKIRTRNCGIFFVWCSLYCILSERKYESWSCLKDQKLVSNAPHKWKSLRHLRWWQERISGRRCYDRRPFWSEVFQQSPLAEMFKSNFINYCRCVSYLAVNFANVGSNWLLASN